MLQGAIAKRFYFVLSALFRFVSFLGLLIAYISVKITVRPPLAWLNALLLVLSLTCLATAVFNLILCGFTATAYKENKLIQIICFVVTLLTGGVASSAFTGLAAFTKVLEDEVKNEKIFNTKRMGKGEGSLDEKKKN